MLFIYLICSFILTDNRVHGLINQIIHPTANPVHSHAASLFIIAHADAVSNKLDRCRLVADALGWHRPTV